MWQIATILTIFVFIILLLVECVDENKFHYFYKKTNLYFLSNE